MEDYELALKLLEEDEGITQTWNCDAFLWLDDDGTPHLSSRYQLLENSKKEEREYTYQNGKWVWMSPLKKSLS